MSEDMFSSMDLINVLKDKQLGRAPQERPKAVKLNAMEAVRSIKDPVAQAAMKNMLFKTVQSPDLASLRLVSLAPRAAELRNKMTIFLNMLEANAKMQLTDFQVRFRERRIGTDSAVLFNPNATGLPAAAQSNYPMRTNTLGFIGNQLNIAFIAQELGNQSPVEPVDIRAMEIDYEITRIRRGMNSTLLSNTEVTSEANASVPSPGGFLGRSTLYNVAAGGDFTNALIQAQVNSIANITASEGYGYTPLVCMMNAPAQLAKIRDLMIARYPGENSESFAATTAGLMNQLANVDVPREQMKAYVPDPGFPVLFVLEPQLPGGTAIFFDPAQPQLGKFTMFGQEGPWVLERPTSDLLYLLLVFDSFCLLDHLVESRAVETTLNQ